MTTALMFTGCVHVLLFCVYVCIFIVEQRWEKYTVNSYCCCVCCCCCCCWIQENGEWHVDTV